MADHDNSSPLFINLSAKNLTNVSSRFGVQGSRRFIGKKNRRVTRQGPCDRHSLFFSGAEFVGLLMELAAQAELHEQITRHFSSLEQGGVANLQTERHVI
jgi:hypothetical protein